MELIKALYEWGFMRNDKVKVGSAKVGIMVAMAVPKIAATCERVKVDINRPRPVVAVTART